MKLPWALREIAWQIQRPGQNPFWTFVIAWLFVWLGIAVALKPSLGSENALLTAVFPSELMGGFLMLVFVKLALRKQFAAHTIRRVFRADEVRAFGDRAELVPSYLIAYLYAHIHDGDGFLFGPLKEAVPVDEAPKTRAQVCRVIMLDLVEKASGEDPPRHTIEPILTNLASALERPNAARLIRDAIRDQYLNAGSGYRRFAVNPPAGRVSQFLKSHPWIVQVLSLISVIIANSVVLIELFSRGVLP